MNIYSTYRYINLPIINNEPLFVNIEWSIYLLSTSIILKYNDYSVLNDGKQTSKVLVSIFGKSTERPPLTIIRLYSLSVPHKQTSHSLTSYPFSFNKSILTHENFILLASFLDDKSHRDGSHRDYFGENL